MPGRVGRAVRRATFLGQFAPPKKPKSKSKPGASVLTPPKPPKGKKPRRRPK